MSATLPEKKQFKLERERAVLFGLIKLYLIDGKPVGSSTLQSSLLGSLSPATIRNYFVTLEKEGHLKQHHASGGRIPTAKGLSLYADSCAKNSIVDPQHLKEMEKKLPFDTQEISRHLGEAAEFLSQKTNCPVFFSFPRFDQDLILSVRLMQLDAKRLLAAILTDFGAVRTEVIFVDAPFSEKDIKKTEAYFAYRMTGLDNPNLGAKLEKWADGIYNEVVLRHIVGYANFSEVDLIKTGFSRLLSYPECQKAETLTDALAVFESPEKMRLLLKKCADSQGKTAHFIGGELHPFTASNECAVIGLPYAINGRIVGSIALLGPMRLDYPTIFNTLKAFSEVLSKKLTQGLYKFKISYREPHHKLLATESKDAKSLLLEDHTN